MKKFIILLIVICLILIPTSPVNAAIKSDINKKILTLNSTETYTLKISGATSVKWTIENQEIATVSKNGLVTPKSEGMTNIYGKVKNKTYKCFLAVTNSDKNYSVYEDDNVNMLYNGVSNGWLCFEYINKTDNNYFVKVDPFNIDGINYTHYLVDSTFKAQSDGYYYYKPSVEVTQNIEPISIDIKSLSGSFTLCYMKDLEEIMDINYSIDLK